jgi:hypothetical protein
VKLNLECNVSHEPFYSSIPVGFDDGEAAAWRSLNYGLLKILEIIDFTISILESTVTGCEALPADALTVTGKATCVTPLTLLIIVIKSTSFVTNVVRCNIRHKFTQVACTISIVHAHHHRSVCT